MSTLQDRVMPEIMAKKVRGSMWGFLKSFYLRRVRYTWKLLAYTRRKDSNGKHLFYAILIPMCVFNLYHEKKPSSMHFFCHIKDSIVTEAK